MYVSRVRLAAISIALNADGPSSDVLTQVPSNMIIGKVKPSYYICGVTAAWGIVSLCQGFTKNFGGLAAARFILGLVEGSSAFPRIHSKQPWPDIDNFIAPFLPGVFFLLSTWYKLTELPPRIAILYGGNIIATAFSGLIAAGSKCPRFSTRRIWEFP